VITLNHGKKYEKSNGNFVVFVTPIIKSSASTGVEQIKKKFRMKE
jgi:pilus assembly protein CpaC